MLHRHPVAICPSVAIVGLILEGALGAADARVWVYLLLPPLFMSLNSADVDMRLRDTQLSLDPRTASQGQPTAKSSSSSLKNHFHLPLALAGFAFECAPTSNLDVGFDIGLRLTLS